MKSNQGIEKRIIQVINKTAIEGNLKPSEVARLSGLTESTYSAITNGRRANKWMPKSVIKILDTLELEIIIQRRQREFM